MKNNNLKQILVLVCFGILGFNQSLLSQPIYKIIESKDIHMKLSGTSTLHNWVMNAKTFTGEAQFIFKEGNDNQLASVKSLSFALEVLNLKSDEKKLDKNAYKALKTDRYKDIVYNLTSATVSLEKENIFLVRSRGNLIIAGVTKEVSIDVHCFVNKDGSISCSGSYKLKMTDYQVKPPSFMLGAMKTGDAITLDFNMVYKKQAGL